MRPRSSSLTALGISATLMLPALFAAASCSERASGARSHRLTPHLAHRLAAVPVDTTVANGLRMVAVFRPEARILLGAADSAGRADTAAAARASVVDSLVREVYRPYAPVWDGYIGGEKYFRELAAGLLANDTLVSARLPAVLDLGLDSLFAADAAWLRRTTGRRVHGTWYLLFGPGWTDMGALGDTTMVADFVKLDLDPERVRATVPHELTHLLRGDSPAHRSDPDAGTVLDRILSEGLACYVSWVRGGGSRTRAQSLGYAESEWKWALAHERALADAARPLLASKDRDDIDRIASRSETLVAGGPTAAGYFLGFRLVQAYVARHGADSWGDLLDLPVRDALAGSGYLLGDSPPGHTGAPSS